MQVTWLNDGIKSLVIETLLPNQGSLSIIKAISLNELELLFTQDTTFDPATSSDDATAAFTIPFGFPLNIIALEQNITAGFQGQSFAQLIIPEGPTSTDVDIRVIHLTFNSTPFAVFGDKHDVFEQFLASTTTSSNQSFTLEGSANTKAETAVGLLDLTNIAFDVGTDIAGLQGLNAKPTIVGNLDVNHGFSDFLLITITTTLFNPRSVNLLSLHSQRHSYFTIAISPLGWEMSASAWSLSQYLNDFHCTMCSHFNFELRDTTIGTAQIVC